MNSHPKSVRELATPVDIKKVIALVLKEADGLENDAGWSGSHHDHGARHLRELVKLYEYGMDGKFPPEWDKYTKTLDPEYSEYVRLKNKFEGR